MLQLKPLDSNVPIFQRIGNDHSPVVLVNGSYLLGQDGRQTAADIVVPEFIEEDEVGLYLAGLLHELATPTNNRAVRLPTQ